MLFRSALSPVIGAIASRLAGAAAIRLWDDQLVWKEPVDDDTTGVVGWHTDRAYWMTCTSEDMLTAWIPFHDCPAEMGPLMVLDGSHRWEGTDQMRSFKNRNLADVGVPIPVQDVKELIRAMALLKGQMSFHHCRTVHGSATNRGSRPRVSLAVHLQDGANHWRPFCNVNGSRLELANDRMTQRHPDGTPDYSDPALFPPYGLD